MVRMSFHFALSIRREERSLGRGGWAGLARGFFLGKIGHTGDPFAFPTASLVLTSLLSC